MTATRDAAAYNRGATLDPLAAITAAQDAIAYALHTATGRDHARLARAAIHVVHAGQALDPRYASRVAR